MEIFRSEKSSHMGSNLGVMIFQREPGLAAFLRIEASRKTEGCMGVDSRETYDVNVDDIDEMIAVLIEAKSVAAEANRVADEIKKAKAEPK